MAALSRTLAGRVIFITGADGALLAEIWSREGIITADVDPADALVRRAGNPWFNAQRPELYYTATEKK